MKRVLLALVLVIATVALIACTPATQAPAPAPTAEQPAAQPAEQPAEKPAAQPATPAAPEKILFGATGLHEDQFTRVLINGYKDKAAELGIEILTSNSQLSIEKESESINNFVEAGVQAMIIEPVNPDASVGMAKVAYDRGIPIFACAIPINGDFVFASSINDNIDLGSSTGNAAIPFLEEKYGKEKEIKCALLGFDGADAYGSQGRIKGFTDTVADFNINYVAKQDGLTSEMAYSATTDILTANPDLNIMYCASEVSLIGAVNAIKAANKAGQVYVFGVDCSVQICDMLLADDDILQAATAQDPYAQGQYAVQTMYDYVVNGKEPAEQHKKVDCILVARTDPDGIKAFSDNWKMRSGE